MGPRFALLAKPIVPHQKPLGKKEILGKSPLACFLKIGYTCYTAIPRSPASLAETSSSSPFSTHHSKTLEKQLSQLSQPTDRFSKHFSICHNGHKPPIATPYRFSIRPNCPKQPTAIQNHVPSVPIVPSNQTLFKITSHPSQLSQPTAIQNRLSIRPNCPNQPTAIQNHFSIRPNCPQTHFPRFTHPNR